MAEQKSSLKKYLDTKKRPTVILGDVERHLLSLPPGDRSTTVLHPSEMCKRDWCIREAWFLLNGHAAKPQSIGLRLASIFSEGHAIHAKWQGWLADMGRLWGVWESAPDEPSVVPEVYTGFRKGPKDTYLEVPIIYPEYRIHGHADGVVSVGEDMVLLEIKSIGIGTLRTNGFPISGGLSGSFRNIQRPFIDHVRQATIYAWTLRNGPSQMPVDKLLFLYECKEDQSAREFLVQYNEEYIESVIDKLGRLFPLGEEPPRCSGPEECGCTHYSLPSEGAA